MCLSSSASPSLLNLSHSLLLSLSSLLSSLSTLLAIITKLSFVNLPLSLKHTYYKISVFYCLCMLLKSQQLHIVFIIHSLYTLLSYQPLQLASLSNVFYRSQFIHATLISLLHTLLSSVGLAQACPTQLQLLRRLTCVRPEACSNL